MKIINTLKIDNENISFFEQLKKYYSKDIGFLELTKLSESLEQPQKEIYCKNISSTIEDLGLDFSKKYKDVYNFRYYINRCNMYFYHYIVDLNDYNSEILTTIYSYYPEMFFENLDNSLSKGNVGIYLEALDKDSFKEFFYNKLVENNNLGVFKEFLKMYSSKGTSYLGNNKILIEFNNKSGFKIVLEKIREIYFNGSKNIDSGEKYYDSDLFFQMNEKEQIDWLQKYNEQMHVYNLNVFSETYNMNKKLGLNIFTPETDTIKYIGDKYVSLKESIMQDDQYCRLLKTLIYGALYVFKDKDTSFQPISNLNNILKVDSSWAVGNERTKDPSFYGNSNMGKFFYGYAPYMTGDRNPYREIINNKTVDRMDTQAIEIHRYFRNHGISDYLYELIFEKEISGDKSLYDVINSVRDLIQVIESPIVVGSLTNVAISMFKGIVSSMINSVISAVDYSLSFTVKQLFYVEFIPIGDKKCSLKDLYNYAVFLKLILSNYEELGAVQMIDKEDFIRKAYNVVGVSERKLEEIGYFAYSRNLNSEEPTYFEYEDELIKRDKIVITCDQNFKILYTMLQFAKQKYLSNYGRIFEGNMASRTTLTNLIRDLSPVEIFYCMNLYNVDFFKLEDKFDDYSLEEYLKFEDDLFNIQSYTNFSSNSTHLYDEFKELGIQIQIKMEQNLFKNINYEKINYWYVENYLKVVRANQDNIEKAIFDKNGISDIDDFLMRFLPSICELAKTFGYNDIGISTIIKVLDYFCYFISDILFKEHFFKIKSVINDQLKQFSEDMFKSMDKFKTDEVIVKFDVGGSLIVEKLDGILKMLEDGVLFSTILTECFKDEGYSYNYWTEHEYVGNNDYTHEDFEYEYEQEGDIIIEKVDKVIYPENETIIRPGDPVDDKEINDIIIDKVKKPSVVVDEDLNITIINPDKDKDENKTIDEIIKIKDKIESIKNKEINKIVNELNQLEKEIENELNKIRPTYPIIKDKQNKIKELNEQLKELKNKVSTPVTSSNEEETKIIISDFINEELNFERVNNVLDEVNKIVYENNIILTNHEIIRLLK